MLSLIRKIQTPDDFDFVGSWIPGTLLNQVTDYRSLMAVAERRIESMEEEFQGRMETQRRQVLEETASKCQQDLKNVKAMFDSRRTQLEDNSANSCVEVTRLAIEQLLRESPEHLRLEPLVRSLLRNLQSNAEVTVRAHPDQAGFVQQVIAEKLAAELGFQKWAVVPDPEVQRERFVVKSAGDSYTEVSIENWLALVSEEVDLLHDFFNSATLSGEGSV